LKNTKNAIIIANALTGHRKTSNGLIFGSEI
jgi:hypothetical protein